MLRIDHKPAENLTEIIEPADVVMFNNVQPFLTPDLDIKLKMKWNINKSIHSIGREAEGKCVCKELEIEPLASFQLSDNLIRRQFKAFVTCNDQINYVKVAPNG